MNDRPDERAPNFVSSLTEIPSMEKPSIGLEYDEPLKPKVAADIVGVSAFVTSLCAWPMLAVWVFAPAKVLVVIGIGLLLLTGIFVLTSDVMATPGPRSKWSLFASISGGVCVAVVAFLRVLLR